MTEAPRENQTLFPRLANNFRKALSDIGNLRGLQTRLSVGKDENHLEKNQVCCEASNLVTERDTTDQNTCRDLQDEGLDIDGSKENELEVTEYVADIYKFYKSVEKSSCLPYDYLTYQPDITETSRASLISWLIEVHSKFHFMSETLYLTVNIIDRYLSERQVTSTELRLLGLTAMLLASKYEEIYVPEFRDFLDIASEYTGDNALAMEWTILNHLKFELTVTTPYVFLPRFLKAVEADKEMENFACFLTELSLVEYKMLKYRPSLVAAAVVYTAIYALNKGIGWSRRLVFHTGYTEPQFLQWNYKH